MATAPTPRQRLLRRHPAAFVTTASDGCRVYLAPDETVPLAFGATPRDAWAIAADLDALAHILTTPHGPCPTAPCAVCG